MKRKAVRIIGYILLAIVFAVFLYMLLFYQEIRATLEYEIQRYGPIGLIVSGFIIDAFGGPLGIEVPVLGGIVAGINLSTVLYMTAVGSVIASLSVYALGYYFGEPGALAFTSQKTFDKWKRRFIKHRRVTMTAGALTPVPYEVVNVVAGVFKVKLWEFVVFTIFARFVRIIGAAYIVLLFQGKI